MKLKVAIINPILPHYRIPLLNILSREYDLTFVHFGKENKSDDLLFTQLVLKELKIGPFLISKINLNKLFKNFDVVISEGNLRYLDRNILILNPFRKYKWITWGIGVTASYDKLFGTKSINNLIRFFLFRFAEANIFYSEFPIKLYLEHGHKRESLFVAHNTVEVKQEYLEIYGKKDTILFVGTLYRQKGVLELIDIYLEYFRKTSNPKQLHIIGNGPEFNCIFDRIKKYKLEEFVFLHGEILDEEILSKFYSKSLVCVSPSQAGLSVLSSFGHGVPFITRFNAVTGGEILNIKSGINGVLYNSNNDLINIFNDVSNNPIKYIEMGKNAFDFYNSNRKIEMMASSIQDSVSYVFCPTKINI
jgi:glycosyltransferase involved in cell wall biosynthesis